LYGGVGCYIIDEEDSKLMEYVTKAPATAWPDYGKTSYETLKAVNFDWSKLDPSFFTIGKFVVTSKRSGNTYIGGKIEPEILRRSIVLQASP
ncbi:MAG: methenyltetrahydromethanopterin cyclohydrolase, partial [Candidatus Nezhaarchaeales archaeon]